MVQPQEIILKEGPAPKTTPTPMPQHAGKKRAAKKTNGPLTGRRGAAKFAGSRKSKVNRSKVDDGSSDTATWKRKRNAEPDDHDFDASDEGGGEPGSKSLKKTTLSEQKLVKIVGIDLGMWGFGRGRASSGMDAANINADLNWPDCQHNQFKNPSMVAYKRDNPDHRAFCRGKDVLIGFNVTQDMNHCSFFKASLDQRAQASKFDNPVLHEDISRSLISFNTPQKDEQAAIDVLRYLYKMELENVTQSFTGLDDQPLENVKLTFVLTHPAACTKAGIDKLEAVAKKAGLDSRPGDEIKLLSEPQAAAMASFISYRAVEKHEVWKTFFKLGSWITVLDIGSLTVDTTTEEILSNDPKLTLAERVVSEGGRCGTVTLHLLLLKLIMKKFGVSASELPNSLVGRCTDFHNGCEHILRTFTGGEGAEHQTLTLYLPDGVEHDDYDASFGEITLKINEIKQVFEEHLTFLKNLLLDQWGKASRESKASLKVKTTVICGGGSMMPYIWMTLCQFCRDHGVKAIRPEHPIAAVCRGAVISQLSDGLLGERILRAHYGIKFEVDGEVYMNWIIKRGDIIDTTRPNLLKRTAGHFSLSIDQVLNRAAKFELKIFAYDNDGREVIDPREPGIEEINSIAIDKSNLSNYLQNKLKERLRHLEAAARKEAELDIEVVLGVNQEGRLYFEVKAGGSSLGTGLLRFDFTRSLF